VVIRDRRQSTYTDTRPPCAPRSLLGAPARSPHSGGGARTYCWGVVQRTRRQEGKVAGGAPGGWGARGRGGRRGAGGGGRGRAERGVGNGWKCPRAAQGFEPPRPHPPLERPHSPPGSTWHPLPRLWRARYPAPPIRSHGRPRPQITPPAWPRCPSGVRWWPAPMAGALDSANRIH